MRGPHDPPGYDAGKKIKGKKRHVLVDTQGLLMHAIVHAADIQDRDGGALVMATLFGMFPFLLKLYADGGYQGPIFRRAIKKVMSRVNVEIVKRSDTAKKFAYCRSAGSSSAPSPSWADAAYSRAIGKTSIKKRSHSSASPQSGLC